MRINSNPADGRIATDGLTIRGHVAVTFCICVAIAVAMPCLAGSMVETIEDVQPKIVKIYGAGGVRNLEAYQSGILISAEGHILTSYSYVLDADTVDVVLFDGRRFKAELLGADPQLEIAVLKIDATGLAYFDAAQSPKITPGVRILAVSNLFGVASGNEPSSVQKGTVAAITRLEARRGVFETPYRGPVYVLDVTTNNPGAAGGAIVTQHGELIGMLGKELRNSLNETWLNYAMPIEELRHSISEIQSGKFVARRNADIQTKPKHPIRLESLGIGLIPDILERTPPYVDHILPGSSAASAGIRPDDLIVLLGDRLVNSCKTLTSDLEFIADEEPVKLTLLRNQDLIEVTLQSQSIDAMPKKERP